ncbi:hypothetical protein ES702_03248 [subsurface metagenome]
MNIKNRAFQIITCLKRRFRAATHSITHRAASLHSFSLTEMLLVMAIILVLAFATVAVIMKAMKKAEEVEQVSDTRQDNINEFIDAIEKGESYDELPEQIREGRFAESE